MADQRYRIGAFEVKILTAIVQLGDNAYGRTIAEEIEAAAGRLPSLGAIYDGLERLTDKEMVTSFMGDATEARGGRRKRLYHVTNTGVQAVRQWRREHQYIAGTMGVSLGSGGL